MTELEPTISPDILQHVREALCAVVRMNACFAGHSSVDDNRLTKTLMPSLVGHIVETALHETAVNLGMTIGKAGELTTGITDVQMRELGQKESRERLVAEEDEEAILLMAFYSTDDNTDIASLVDESALRTEEALYALLRLHAQGLVEFPKTSVVRAPAVGTEEISTDVHFGIHGPGGVYFTEVKLTREGKRAQKRARDSSRSDDKMETSR